MNWSAISWGECRARGHPRAASAGGRGSMQEMRKLADRISRDYVKGCACVARLLFLLVFNIFSTQPPPHVPARSSFESSLMSIGMFAHIHYFCKLIAASIEATLRTETDSLPMTLRELKVGQSAIITTVGGAGEPRRPRLDMPQTRRQGRGKPCVSISWTWELFQG